MEGPEQNVSHPWFTIWVRPRATIRAIIDRDPTYLVIVLAILGGFVNSLDRAASQSLGDKHSIVFIFGASAGVGVIWGVIWLYLFSFLLRWTGRWIGGNAEPTAMHAAVGWSNIPIIWAFLILWIPQFALFGGEIFREETPLMEASPVLSILFLVVAVVLAIWGVVIFLKCVAEAQGYSAWKALLNSILALLLVIVPVFGIVWLVV